jgi:hypothetical protein
MKPKHTPGPWRFELNLKARSISLVGNGGNTVMDFARWGMSNAAPRFISDDKHHMQRADVFVIPCPGREHHAHWFNLIKHPDAQLIEAAPELLTFAFEAWCIATAHAASAPTLKERSSAQLFANRVDAVLKRVQP